MKKQMLRVALLIVVAGAILPDSVAQLPQTRLTSVFPPGGQRGTTVEVTITGGTDLDEVDQLIFSHSGITAAPKLDAAGNPVASTFVVSVDSSVPVGFYDARARGLFGISNPRVFQVGTISESPETEPNNTRDQAMSVPLNTLVNARSNGATDVDFYRFQAEAGQTVVIRAETARIDSTMQPLLQLFNSSGRRLAESRRIFRKNANLVYTASAAEELILKVTDQVYAGGNDYVYRLSVDTRPLVDFVMPSVVSTTQPTTVTLFGRYLPGGQPSGLKIEGIELLQTTMEVPAVTDESSQTGFASFSAPLNGFWWQAQDGNLISMSTGTMGGIVAAEDAADQMISVPADISGQFAQVGDEDIFRFEAKKGETWAVDVFAHRLDSNSDPLLMIEQVVKAADGTETFKRLATEDDDKQNPGGADLPTLSSDPSFQLVVPEDGIYRVRVRDRYADSRGDPHLTYRLTVRRPAADFRLVVFDAFPSADGKAPGTAGAISLRKSGTYQLNVYAYRRDGHNDTIHVTASQLPAGVTCPPVVIGPGQVSATLVFSASAAASELATPVRIIGRSGTDQAPLIRNASVATLVHDAVNGLPRTARMTDSLVVGVMKDEQPFSILVPPMVAGLSQDQQLLIPVTLQRRGGFDGKVDFAFTGVPANVDAPVFAIDKGSDRAIARLFLKDNAPVSANTIVIYGTAAVPYRRNPWMAERAAQKVVDAEAALATRQKMAADTAAALTAAMQAATAGSEKIAALMKEIADITAQEQPIRDAFTKALADYKNLIADVDAVRKKLVLVQASKDGNTEEYDLALKAITEAAAAAEAASAKVNALAAQAKQSSEALATVKQAAAAKTTEKTELEAKLPELMKAAEAAQAAVTAAQKIVETAQAEKTAADEAAKKANEATKVNNVNVRLVSAPVVLNIHAAPAKLAAAVPDAGALKKGASMAVKVTVTRKNGFAGAMKVALAVPVGVTGISSDVAALAADQTEATVTISAAADATVGDVANLVIQATGEFNGRSAAVDVPIALKITE